MTGHNPAPDYQALARAVVREVLGWTDPGRRLSAPLRAELLRVLPNTLVGTAHREAYLTHLAESRRASGQELALDRVAAAVDFPSDEFLQNGVEDLADDRLAVLATDPALLAAIAELIDITAEDGTLGRVWWDAMARVGAAAYPTLPARPAAPMPDATGNTVPVATSVPTATAKRTHRLVAALPWAITAAAVAFAVCVWVWKGVGETGFEIRSAQAGVGNVTPRGGGNALAFEVSVTAERSGFATIVLLTPGQKPRVFPDYGQDEKRVGPKDTAADGPFEAAAGTTVVVVVTETPATDLVRRALATLTPDAATLDVVRERIRERLTAFGHRWAAIGSTVVTDPKP